MSSEVIVNLSDHRTTFCRGDVTDKIIERFSEHIDTDSGGIAGPIRKTRYGEYLYISKLHSPVDAKVSLCKCFGCGICEELLDTEMEFLEHCSSHRFSQPDDLLTDQCCIMFPHD